MCLQRLCAIQFLSMVNCLYQVIFKQIIQIVKHNNLMGFFLYLQPLSMIPSISCEN